MTTKAIDRKISPYEVESGDLVRTRYSQVHSPSSVPDDCQVEVDGVKWVFGKARRSTPDSDGDIKVWFCTPDGQQREASNYFDAGALYEFDPPFGPDEELAEKLDEDTADEDRLAVLEEEQQNLVQMQEIRASTVRDGLLTLPVAEVTSAENSPQWAVVVEHPVIGDLQFYFKKPVVGWSDEYDIVPFMESYGIMDGNPYKLQQHRVYVEYTGDAQSDDPEISGNWQLRRRDEIINEESDHSDQQQPQAYRNRLPEINARDRLWSGVETIADHTPSEAITAAALPVGVLLWPIVGLSLYPKIHEDNWGYGPDSSDWLMEYFLVGYLLCLLAWMVAGLLVGIATGTLTTA